MEESKPQSLDTFTPIQSTGDRAVELHNLTVELPSPKDERVVPTNPTPDTLVTGASRNAKIQHVTALANTHQFNTNTPQEQGYYYAGYENISGNWNEHSNYVNPNNLNVIPPAIYNDNSSLFFPPSYGFDSQIKYGQYSPLASPLSPIMIDGQLFSHQMPLTPSYYQPPISPGPPHVDHQPRHFGQGGSYQNFVGSSDKGGRRERNRDTFNMSTDTPGISSYRNRGPRASKPKNMCSLEEGSSAGIKDVESINSPDFITDYERARFFVIKSFSEDNVHKSIKYSVWASTPLGNRKLDAAYRESEDREGICPVFLLFSVNASGQFCGVAEMIGHVDFDNDADYWQQDRWSGQFPVKWDIVKDVPNNHFRHILLENNDNKPVTHSRDSQEVRLEHGIEMLKIFKSHDLDTSLLQDFGFYDEREKTSSERKAKNRGGNTEATESINRLSGNLVEALRL